MILIAVLFGIFCVFMIGYKVGEKSVTKKEVNPFIRAHKTLSERDDMYQKYSDWCYQNGTYPLENFEFFSELENNKKLREQFEKVLNG